MNFTREQLHERHRLSHQQIDQWLGEDSGKRFVNEKVKQLERVNKFLEISSLFKQHDVYFVNIKGPLLSYRIYGDPTVRFSHDADFLINLKDVEKVIQILFEKGYQFLGGISWPQKKAQQELLIRTVRHLSFIHPKTNFVVETHWVLMQVLPFSTEKQRKIVADNLCEVEFGGQRHVVLAPELELVYLMIHGSSHGWERLKWLVDIKEYRVEKIDRKKFNILVKQFHCGRILSQTNFLLNEFFQIPELFPAKKRVPKYFLKYALNSIEGEMGVKEDTHDVIHNFRNEFLMFTGLVYKIRVVGNNLFRPKDLNKVDSSLKIVYYLYRPYSFIKRRILHVG